MKNTREPKLTDLHKKAFANAPGIELAEDAVTYTDDDGDLWAESWVRVKDVVYAHIDPDEIYAETNAILEKHGEKTGKDPCREGGSEVPTGSVGTTSDDPPSEEHLLELQAIEPGDAVTYRHGKGFAIGTFVRSVFERSGMKYRIKKPSGDTVIRTDMWKTEEKAS